MFRFPECNVPGGVALVVPGLCVDPGLGQYPDQLPLAHGGRDVERRVPVLVVGRHPGPGADQDPRDPHVSVPGRGVEGGVPVLNTDGDISQMSDWSGVRRDDPFLMMII